MFPKGRQSGTRVGNSDETTRMLLSGGAYDSHSLLHSGMVHPQYGSVRHHRVRARVRKGDDMTAHFCEIAALLALHEVKRLHVNTFTEELLRHNTSKSDRSQQLITFYARFFNMHLRQMQAAFRAKQQKFLKCRV